MSSPHSLSKTSFLKFEQCPKAFFMYKNFPFLKDKVSVDKQLTFKRGHDVGHLAQQLFEGGIDVSTETSGSQKALDLTKQLIEKKHAVIYEAAFMHQSVLIYVDILVLSDDKYYAYEVKSSLKVSETYLKDAYLQYYILKNCLPNFDDLFLVTLNGDYRLDGQLAAKKLFKKRSVKTKAEENIVYFDHRLTEANLLLEQNVIPNTPIGGHCFKPYQCDFFGSCWKDLNKDNSIFNLPLIDKNKLFEWYGVGYRDIAQLNESLFEKEHQKKLWKSILNQQRIINLDTIAQFVKDIKEPMITMDMEIWNPAIPQLQGSKPFEQIPFLVCTYDGDKTNQFFIEDIHQNTHQFAQALINLTQDYQSVLVYDKSMEVNTIDTLIKLYPELKEALQNLKHKIHDLFDVFLGLHFYDPAFKNNFTLKNTSAVLLGEQSGYSKISSGLEAMNFYQNYLSIDNPFEKEEIKNELVTYCSTDCKATFELFGFLKAIL
jgi:hypothetical protein